MASFTPDNAVVRPLLVHVFPKRTLQSSKPVGGLSLIRFDSLSKLKRVHKVLLKNNDKITNGDGVPIRIGLAYDGRQVGNNRWCGVVLRNLPANTTAGGIRENFRKPGTKSEDFTPNYTILEISKPV